MSFQVDPDALTAASRLASKQHDHIARIDDYISSVCSDFGAFSGVLNLFQGSYESAVATAHDGLRDSRAVAEKVRDAFLDSRQDYLDTDEATYDRFRALSPDAAHFPPYDPAGSGNDTPGGPSSQAPTDGKKIPPLEDKAPGVDDATKKVADTLKPGNEVPKPPDWMDPKKAAQDAVMNAAERRTDEYRYYRSLGYSDQEALDFAKTDSVDAHRDTAIRDRIDARAETAYNTEYDRQIAAGATPEDARERANDAYADSRSVDSADHDRRTGVGSTVSTYADVIEQGQKTVKGIEDLADNVTEIGKNADDLDKYDQYESHDEDESAQEWAR